MSMTFLILQSNSALLPVLKNELFFGARGDLELVSYVQRPEYLTQSTISII